MSDIYSEKWEALEVEINRRGADGRAVVAALKDFYSIYNESLVIWLAKLYNPEVGGFYYSNSARDNERVAFHDREFELLPDVESTNQAIRFLREHKIINDYGELPERMRDQMFRFVSKCQDPETGFFYHPQWTKEMVNARHSRRGRDLMWAENMAEWFGWKYPYPTANERLLKMQTNKDTAVQINEDAAVRIPEYFCTEEKFLAYLQGLDFYNKPYYYGNEIAAQIYPIMAAGLSDVLADYMSSIQNPDTGLWGRHDGYEAINGHMKITCAYTEAGRMIPNADKATESIRKGLTSKEPVETVCYQYNVWYALDNIRKTLRSLGGEVGNQQADIIVSSLLAFAPEAIKATKEKILVFRKEDGTFFYAPKESCCTSQGMPVAIPHTNEGDVNASLICSAEILHYMYEALELSDFYVPVFSPNAYHVFLNNLKLQ